MPSRLVLALGAEPAVARGLDSAFVGAVAPADEAVSVVVVRTFALPVFVHISLFGAGATSVRSSVPALCSSAAGTDL